MSNPQYCIKAGLSREVGKAMLFTNTGTRIIFFDTETTGKNDPDPVTKKQRKDEVVQFVAQRYVVTSMDPITLELEDTYETYVKPSIPMTDGASRVNGITDEFLQDKPTWKDVHWEIKEFLGEHILCAHNAGFDLKMTNRMMRTVKDKFDPKVLIDTLAISQYLYPGVSHRLEALVSYLDLKERILEKTTASFHDAKTDVIALACLYEKLLQDAPAQMAKKISVPYIIKAWRTGYRHDEIKTVFLVNDGKKIVYDHYRNTWESDDIDVGIMNMKVFEENVFEKLKVADFTQLKNWGKIETAS